MRFITVLAALIAAVAAQNSTSHSISATASLSPQQTCLSACGYADICCQAACVGVPCPNQAQANATTECAAKCPQGNGTAADTQHYAACQSSCISSYFLTATGSAIHAATSGSDSSSSFVFGQTTATGSATGSNSGSTSRSGSATATATSNGAAETRAVLAGAGLFGLLVFGLTL